MESIRNGKEHNLKVAEIKAKMFHFNFMKDLLCPRKKLCQHHSRLIGTSKMCSTNTHNICKLLSLGQGERSHCSCHLISQLFVLGLVFWHEFGCWLGSALASASCGSWASSSHCYTSPTTHTLKQPPCLVNNIHVNLSYINVTLQIWTFSNQYKFSLHYKYAACKPWIDLVYFIYLINLEQMY